MRTFLAGLLLGWFATYWYYTQGEDLRLIAMRMWTRASAPAGVVQRGR